MQRRVENGELSNVLNEWTTAPNLIMTTDSHLTQLPPRARLTEQLLAVSVPEAGDASSACLYFV